ncbi:MAG TPA: phenylalanine--tRNA ligase subunit beta, partial [Luteibaculaceae bacterium]|nr:phenylalanine--tRNA ligase subunit beta [Luteibaculaceae bacterium]
IEVQVADTERCPRYAGIYISQVQVKPSPEWLQKRLRTIGVRPINNIVDITNYICHGLGQPLHAFDADKITGNTICVRTFDEGTVFTTLDEVERKLHADDLMIADRENPLCLAGVFGGKESGVSEQTRHIFLESAYFNPVSVRKTAKRHGLSTDSSFRFERGIDPNQTLHALQIAAQMICDLAGGKADAQCIDIQAQAFSHHEVTFDLARASVLIGEKLSNARVEQIFEQLEIQVQSVENGVYQLLVPPYRVDVQRECDIVEEILRIISFNAIEIPVKTAFSVSTQRNPEPEKYYNTAAQWLSSRGFSEALNNSLTKAVYAEWTNSETIHAQAGVEVLNPLSSELNALRQTLFFGGMENLAFNVNRRNNDLRIYEFGRTYQNKNGKFAESHQLGIWMSGSESPELWRQKSQEVDFFSLKETALALLQRLGIGEGLKMAESDAPWFVRSMSIAKNGQTLCHLGEVRQGWNQRFDIKQTVYYAEFNWDALLKWAGQAIVKYKPLNKFPSVRRDLSLLVDRSIKFADIENLAFKTERKLLQEVSLFDVYEGKNLPADKKSYAVSLILADTEKTLTDSVIENTMSRITAALAKELAAQLRM